MNRRLVGIALGALVALFLVWFFALRGSGSSPKPPTRGSGAVTGQVLPRPLGGGATAEAPPPESVGRWTADPIGGLVLEGQVLDDQDQPVKGAEVSLSSVPPRTATSGDDGSFAFDRLVGRSYAVSARAGDLFGGPVVQALTDKSPPVVVRLTRGATIRVHVLADGDAAPLAGALVALQAAADQTATTGADGVATFSGVAPGWVNVVATPQGYAPADGGTFVGSGAPSIDLTLLAHKGALVAGVVVDDKGQPVASASVTREDAGRAWETGALAHLAATTNAKGEFSFPVVPAGSYRFVARHETLAPSSSQPITVDGVHDSREVKIVMQPGGVLTGQVVTADGAPAAYASVSAAPKQITDLSTWGGVRRVTADDKGEFTLRALPRGGLQVRAESDAAASAIADVDLAARPTARIKLVLDVSGTISGVVVDSGGQPVPEVQVAAVADLWGGDVQSYVLSGFATATTDGGGAFAVHGLADGEYEVSAHRHGMSAAEGWAQKGVKAKPGATGVRLVLPTPGAIKGKLVLASGAAPKLAIVSVSFQRSTAAIDGAFELADLEPGSYDVTVRGPDFAPKTVRDVEVGAGKTADAGTIQLVRGRQLVGTVKDASGAPVAGATVRVGRMIFSEGGKAGADNPELEERFGLRIATTGADGGFAIVGISKDGGTVVAEHPDRGRSDAVRIGAGTDDPPRQDLVLHGFGSVAGTVTQKGQPVQAMVIATPKTSGAQLVSVQTGTDGAYVLDKVAEGTHRLTAMRMGMTSFSGSEGVDVAVRAGARVTQNLEIPVGDLTLEVTIKPKAGATVNAAQVFLFRGALAVKNAKELTDAFTSGGATAGGMQFWTGTGPVKFTEALPGRVSVCSIPITGDLRDSKLQQRLQAHGDLLSVYCKGVELTPTPKTQAIEQELPAMNQLPED